MQAASLSAVVFYRNSYDPMMGTAQHSLMLKVRVERFGVIHIHGLTGQLKQTDHVRETDHHSSPPPMTQLARAQHSNAATVPR